MLFNLLATFFISKSLQCFRNAALLPGYFIVNEILKSYPVRILSTILIIKKFRNFSPKKYLFSFRKIVVGLTGA